MFSSLSALRSASRISTPSTWNSLLTQQQRLVSVLTVGSSPLLIPPRVPLIDQQRNAARKGTRERKAKKLVKTEVAKKQEFVPYATRMARLHVPEGPRRLIEKGKPYPIDDVYQMRHFMTQDVKLAEAIDFHRESNHPTVYNSPDALIFVKAEFDLRMEKKNRFLDTFSRLVLLPHSFEYERARKVLAFCANQETQDEAIKGGAEAAGGVELIKRIKAGEVSLLDYDCFVAHTNMMLELTPLRGLMKKNFPQVKSGSLGTNLAHMIERFSRGIEFTVNRDPYELDYGVAQIPFGRINMPTQELEANFDTILKDVETCRGRTTGAFITRCFVLSPPSPERFVVKAETYVGSKEEDSSSSSSDDEDSDAEDGKEKDDEESGVKVNARA
nr:EOG090X089S [Chydorus sphaericus]